MTDAQPDAVIVARTLIDHLGPNIVSAIGGAQHSSTSSQWTGPDACMPADAAERLNTAYQAWQILDQAGAGAIAARWFIGQNPHLDDTAPFMAIRDGQHDAVLHAANTFIQHHWHAPSAPTG